MTNNTKKTSLKLLLGIPVLLLILSLFLFNNEVKTLASSENVNPYLNDMPNIYVDALSTVKENDSTFFCSVIEDFAIRELIIFKTSPNSIDIKVDFIIELYPSDSKHLKDYTEFLTFNLIRDAAVFNNNDKTYGVFKTPLPVIDIEKIIIKQKGNNIKKELWTAVIEKPFKKLDKKVVPNEFAYGSKLYQPNPYSLLFTETLKNNNIEVLPSSFSKRNDTLFNTRQGLSDYCDSNNKTIGKVNQEKLFWNRVNSKDGALKKQIRFNGIDGDKAKQLLKDFISEKRTLDEVFNIQKLAFFNALRNVYTSGCDKEVYFVFNRDDNLLEPFYVKSACLGVEQKFVTKSNIEDNNYLRVFANKLDEVSNVDYYSELIKNNISFKNELALINDYNTNVFFNYDIIKINQKAIKKSLNPSSALKVELISIDSQKMIVSTSNITNYPIEILGLNHLDKKEITNLNPTTEILSGQKDTITIDLPRSFENLFVNKKKKITGFVLPKHIYELNIQYRISGANKTYASSIIPYQKQKKTEDDLFRSPVYINNHKYIVVDEKKKEISFSKDSVVISSPLVIQKGYTFTLKPGTIVNIMEGGKIISHSPLSLIGTKQTPIKVYSSDKRGQGLLVLSGQKKSILKHVVFDQLRNPTHGSWGVTGAVTFYESPVDLEFVAVKNNKCEDALNIVRTNFIMNQVTLLNTQSDAFDGDFVKGSILNCQFDKLGNDAIDVSGSDLIIKNVTISNAGDKGLSAGENSKMTIDKVEVSNSAIAVAGKDLSIVDAKNLTIINTKLGFTAFQKKPEFGPSKITVNGISMTGIETNYLIESSSSLIVDNKKIETTQNVKDRMYGVEFGVSSDETRNTPQ